MTEDLPPALAAKIEELEEELADAKREHDRYRYLVAELETRIEDCREAADLCRAAWCAQEGEQIAAAVAMQDIRDAAAGVRPRRDMREVVRQILKAKGFRRLCSVAYIAMEASRDGRKISEVEIRKTLVRMNGEVEQAEHNDDLWRLATGPANAMWDGEPLAEGNPDGLQQGVAEPSEAP